MNITRHEFKEYYKNIPLLLQNINTFYTIPRSVKELTSIYLPSKLWRLNNIYTIINKRGETVKFVMNKSQHKVYAMHLEHPRLIILKSRQQGISTLWLLSFFDDCITLPNITSGLIAQGHLETSNLLKRVKFIWDKLDIFIKNFLQISLDKSNQMEFSLSNGSSLLIRTSFRAATLQRLHISELGKIANEYPNRATEIKTGTLQAIAAGNTAIIESTAEGDNAYKTMWDKAMMYAGELTPKDFKPIFLSWLDDPDCTSSHEQQVGVNDAQYFNELENELGYSLTLEQKNFWIMQKRELGISIYQEYPATAREAFMKNRDGTYYADIFIRHVINEQRIVPNLFEPKLPVYIAVDLGRNDLFVLIFFQVFTDGWRLINNYINTGQGIKHYCEVIDELASNLKYDIQTIVLPHDASVKDLTSDITREEAFWAFGYKDTMVVEKTNDINNDRELVRQAIETMFVDANAQYIIDCFLNYTKEYDEKREVWKELHHHNKYSHGADAIRQMVRSGIRYYSDNEIRENEYINRGIPFDI